MPHSELHQRRRRKNWAVMAAAGGFALLVFIITLVQLAVHS